MCKKAFKTILPIAASVLGNMVLPGIGGAIGSGLGTLASGGKPLAALGSGLGTYFGGNLFGGAGNVGPGGTIASGLGGIGLDSVANMLPSELAGAGLSEVAGSFVGSNLGANVGEALGGPPKQKTAQPNPFKAGQKAAGNAPLSLSQFSGLSPEQTTTGIATQGVYGGGAGNEESQYFLNLINNRLVDESGQVDNDFADLMPIEMSFLDQLGLGKKKNPYELLQGMSQYSFA